jgi:dipeptidase E
MGGGLAVLTRLLRGGRRVGVVENALDHIPRAERIAYKTQVYDSAAEFRALGLDVVEIDLRAYFGSEGSLRRDVAGLDLIWAVGGNAFLLRKAFAQSGLDQILRSRLLEDTLAYGGFSAGAVILAPSLRGVDMIDDPNLSVPGYHDAPLWEGLGLIDFVLVPHYKSAHKESALAEKLVARYRRDGTAHLALADGEVFVLDGGDRARIDRSGRLRPVFIDARARVI